MKVLFTILCLICFTCSVFAVVPNSTRVRKYPEGTFRKQRNGTIVQYNKSGKKIGVYKLNNGRYVRAK